MTYDFRSNQIQTNKIIASGSTGANAKLLIYSEESEDKSSPNSGLINPNAFGTGSIGEDIFLYVSGTISSGSSADRIAVVGGSLVISGNISIKGHLSASSGDANKFESLDVVDTTIGSLNFNHPSDTTLNATAVSSNGADDTLVLSGVNVAVKGKTAGLLSINRPEYSGYESGFSSVVASGSEIQQKAYGVVDSKVYNYSVSVTQSNLEIKSISSGSTNLEIHSTSDQLDSLVDVLAYSTGADATVSMYAIGAGGASLSTVDIVSIAQQDATAKLNSESTSADSLTSVSSFAAASASLDISASAPAYAKVRIKSESSTLATTASVEIQTFDVVVSASRSIFHENESALGRDTSFYVSGTIGGIGSNTGKVAVFGGDLLVSGNFSVLGTGGGGGGGGTNISVTGSDSPITSSLISLHMSAASLYSLSSSTSGDTVVFHVDSFNPIRDLEPEYYWNAESVVTSSNLVVTLSNLGSAGSSYDMTQSTAIYQCARYIDSKGNYFLSPDGINDHYSSGDVANWNFLHDGTQEYFIWGVYRRTGSLRDDHPNPPPGVAYNYICLVVTNRGTTLSSGLNIDVSKNPTGEMGPESDYGIRFETTFGTPGQYTSLTKYVATQPVTKSLVFFGAQLLNASDANNGGYRPRIDSYINGKPIYGGNTNKVPSGSNNVDPICLFGSRYNVLITSSSPTFGLRFFNGHFYEMGIVKGLVPQWKIDRLTQYAEEKYGSFK